MDIIQAKNFLEENEIKFVLAQFVDIHGVAKTKAVPAHHLDMILEDGAGFAGFAVWGLDMEPHDADFMAKGDLNTLHLLPWMPGYARIVCNGYVNDKPYPLCTRTVLLSITEELKKKGLRVNVGMEPEFYLLKKTETGEVIIADKTDRLEKPCYDFKGLSRSRNFLEQFIGGMQEVGLDVYQIDHEDSNGQFEINFKYTDALTTSDNYVFCRMIGGEIANQNGIICSFMPKPFAHRTGNGAHMHISIMDSGNKNLFHDDSDKRNLGLSEMGYHFLGGLLHHAKALTALCAPSVNSYKRLVIGRSLSGATWAPAFISYGDNNRTTMVRIPYGRIELRVPDSACNPYLANAAMIVAGMDGIENGIDPGEPTNRNHYTMTMEEIKRAGIGSLPQNLGEALKYLEEDELFANKLGERLIKEFCKVKKMEWIEYMKHVSDWEISRYLEFY